MIKWQVVRIVSLIIVKEHDYVIGWHEPSQQDDDSFVQLLNFVKILRTRGLMKDPMLGHKASKWLQKSIL